MDEAIRVSIEKKLSLFRKYLLICEVAECYSNDKPSLRALRKIVCREQKLLKSSRFPIEESDRSELLALIGDLKQLFTSFLHASQFEMYRLAGDNLTRYLGILRGKISETEALLRGKSTVQETIDAAVSKAKELGEALGKGVESLKKRVKDLGSE